MPNRKIISVVMLSMLLLLSGCTGAQETTVDTGSKVQKAVPQEHKSVDEQKKEQAMKLIIDDKVVPVTWEQNASTAALQKLLPLKVNMPDFGYISTTDGAGKVQGE